MKVKVLRIVLILVAISTISFLYPIGKLALTDNKITKSLFFEQYYVKVNSNQNESDVLQEYMEANGWNQKDQLGGLYIFEKDGKERQIFNTDVKTIFTD